jgi:hypothetical protein
MAGLKHTNVTIITTMLSVMLVLLALSLPWYTVRLTYSSTDFSETTTWVFHLDYAERTSTHYGIVYPGPVVYEDEDLSSHGFDEVEALITMTKWAIGLWAFFSLVYVWSLLGGAPAFRRGWGMIVVASLPVFMFAFSIQNAVLDKLAESGTIYTEADWILSSGWLLTFGAWSLQTVGVILRQRQLLSSDSRRRKDVLPRREEDSSNGDQST